MPAAHGPDVSRYQHITDEALVPQFRLASCKLSEGRSYADQSAPGWVALFNRKGVRNKGLYHWIRSDSPVEDQVAHVVRRLQAVGVASGNDLAPGWMIQLDWETTPGIPNVTVAQVEQFIYLIHVKYGDRLITYASDWVPGFVEWRRKHPRAPLWYANYNLGTSPTGGRAECEKWAATVWQWTSTYKCPGIASGQPGGVDTGIDMNEVCDWPTLDRLCLLSPAVPAPTPSASPTPPEDDMDNPVKYRRVFVRNGPEAHLTIRVKGYKDPNERDVVAAFDEADALEVSPEQYAALLAVYTA